MTQDQKKDLEQRTDSTTTAGRVLHRRVTRTVESEEFFSEPQCPPVTPTPAALSGAEDDGALDANEQVRRDCGCPPGEDE